MGKHIHVVPVPTWLHRDVRCEDSMQLYMHVEHVDVFRVGLHYNEEAAGPNRRASVCTVYMAGLLLMVHQVLVEHKF